MSLKNEDQEQNTANASINQRDQQESDFSPIPTVTSVCSVESNNLIMQSMKEALIAMNEKSKRQKGSSTGHYERMI